MAAALRPSTPPPSLYVNFWPLPPFDDFIFWVCWGKLNQMAMPLWRRIGTNKISWWLLSRQCNLWIRCLKPSPYLHMDHATLPHLFAFDFANEDSEETMTRGKKKKCERTTGTTASQPLHFRRLCFPKLPEAEDQLYLLSTHFLGLARLCERNFCLTMGLSSRYVFKLWFPTPLRVVSTTPSCVSPASNMVAAP